ncbi:hypothetical protein LSM04_006813 [Trypanosoma melophagium]|uniref:uncharacterized protein n=1 Tax=Trypanosoma melophagium TaxID=715481 RepID=UPI00351A4805|nr:hypothetical protein LSM04_006813 [Trypanosoma melophagium]
MWRLNYAMYGDLSIGRYLSPAERRIPLSGSPHCTHVSLILRDENNNISSNNNNNSSSIINGSNGGCSSDCCFLAASVPPHGRLLTVNVKGCYAEMREAQVCTHNPSRTIHVNREGPRMCRVSHSPVLPTSLSNVVDVDTEDNNEKEEENNNCNYYTVPLYTTGWRHVSSTALFSAEEHEPMQRLRHYSTHERTLSALAADAVYQLHMEPLACSAVCEFDRASVNATALDYWGPNSVVISFSSGEVCVVDWRDPNGGLLFHTSAPQPLLSGQTTVSRYRRSAPVVGGIMSCCALEDSFRVVCGLGDSHGTVVVADLRKSITVSRDTMKRGRKSFADEAREAVVSGCFSTPTGYPVCDMRHCRLQSGIIGMVDTGGTSRLTTIGTLESGILNKKMNNSIKASSSSARTPSQQGVSFHSGGMNIFGGHYSSSPHLRTLRCDVSQDGSFLINTRARLCTTAIRTWDGKSTDLTFSGEENEIPFKESIRSISLMDSIVCAETEGGNALCATVHMS